ncbi:hypothetical protein [Desulfosporosinus sp. HMP52]|nr:hypothetical protein [Desulfosporosinus sp. HMP52]
MGRSVAKSSSAFRIPNTEVKTSRANDTWGIAPGKVGYCQVNKRKNYL